MGMPLKTGE